jgi:TonB family protein
MFSRSVAFAACAILTAPAPLSAAAPAPLQPTSKWNVDYDAAQCTAARNYGTEDKPVLLVLKSSPFGGVIRVLVAARGGFASSARELEASIQFDDRPRIRTSALKFSDDEKRLTIYSVNVAMKDLKDRQFAKTISLSASGLGRTFAVDSISQVLAELEKCRLDLLDMYNADNSRVREGAKPIKPLSEIYSGRDYPLAAAQQRDQGTVAISLLIEETGKVADCSVDDSAGAATLDTMSCYVIMQRASFSPAISLDGKPIRSVYTQRITWRLKG